MYANFNVTYVLGLTNADISVMLGEKWSKMTLEEKQPYFDEADLIKEQHRRDHPGNNIIINL